MPIELLELNIKLKVVILILILLIFIIIKRILKLKKREREIEKYIKSPLSRIDKMSGEEFEKYLYHIYKSNEKYRVELTPNTGDFGIDLIVDNLKIKKRLGIQAKRYKGKVGVSAVQEVVAGKRYYNCDVVCVVTNSYFTKSCVELAKINDVVLIDRKDLKAYLQEI